MKTYAEANGKKPFDWNEFLKKKDISNKEWRDARDLSESWVTCACGNQCDIIPRSLLGGSPDDIKLKKLGVDFNYAIDIKDIKDAKKILKAIEKRSFQIIKDLTK